jgi:hypothetical protein
MSDKNTDQTSINITGKKTEEVSNDQFSDAKTILAKCKTEIKKAFGAARDGQEKYTEIDNYIKNFKNAVENFDPNKKDEKDAALQKISDEAKQIGVKPRTSNGIEIYVENGKYEIITTTDSNANAQISANLVNPKFYTFAGLVNNRNDDVKVSGRENLEEGKSHFYGSFEGGKRKAGAYIWNSDDTKYIGSFDGPINGYGCWKMKDGSDFVYIFGDFKNENYGTMESKKQVPYIYFPVSDGTGARYYYKDGNNNVVYNTFKSSQITELKGIIDYLRLEEDFNQLGMWESVNRWAEDKFNLNRYTLYLLGVLAVAGVGYAGRKVYKYFKRTSKKKHHKKSRWDKFDNPSSSYSSSDKNKITSKIVNTSQAPVMNEVKKEIPKIVNTSEGLVMNKVKEEIPKIVNTSEALVMNEVKEEIPVSVNKSIMKEEKIPVSPNNSKTRRKSNSSKSGSKGNSIMITAAPLRRSVRIAAKKK